MCADIEHLWSIMEEDDVFDYDEESEYMYFSIGEKKYKLHYYKLCDSPIISNIFSTLYDYLLNVDNIQTISSVFNEKSSIAKYYESLDISSLTGEMLEIAQNCVKWINSRNFNETLVENYKTTTKIIEDIRGRHKNKLVLCYKLLKYLSSTKNVHCSICGCITDKDRQVCCRTICIDVACNRRSFVNFDDSILKQFIKKSLKASINGGKEFLEPLPVNMDYIKNNIDIATEIYVHSLNYQFTIETEPCGYGENITDKYDILRNIEECQFANSITAYHGSPLNKWISILRGGLVPLSGTKFMSAGAVYGPGVYFADNVSTSIGYAGSGAIAVCKINGEKKPNVPYYVIKDPANIYIYHLLIPK